MQIFIYRIDHNHYEEEGQYFSILLDVDTLNKGFVNTNANDHSFVRFSEEWWVLNDDNNENSNYVRW